MRARVLAASVLTIAAVAATTTATPAQAEPPPGGETTPPEIAIDMPASPGQGAWQGWYAAPVTVTVSATDAAGIASFGYRLTGAQTGQEASDLEPLSVVVDQPGVTTLTATAEDTNGNTATRVHGIGVDLTDPTIEAGGTVLDGQVVRRGDARTLTFACTDAVTAVASCSASGGLVSGGLVPTGTLGAHRIILTAIDQVGRVRNRTIDYTVEKPLLRSVGGLAIVGNPSSVAVGQVLTAAEPLFQPAAERVTYQWMRFNTLVGTGPTYTATPEDVGARLSLRAIGHRADHTDTPVPYSVGFVLVQPGEFHVSGTPRVTGTAQPGAVLHMARAATIDPAPAIITNLWAINGVEHETDAPRLELTSAHVGTTITCVQVYSRPGYSNATIPCVFPGGAGSVVVTSPSGPLPGAGSDAAWSVLAPPSIKGKARVGGRLRAVLPHLSAPAVAWRYQWLRNGKPIKAATAASYRIRRVDRGRRIAVRVIASSPGRTDLVSTTPLRRIRR